MIIVSQELIQEKASKVREIQASFFEWDNGDVFNMLKEVDSPNGVPGTIKVVKDGKKVQVNEFGSPYDKVRILSIVQSNKVNELSSPSKNLKISGFVRKNSKWEKRKIQVIPVGEQIFSRCEGVLETSVLSDKYVVIIGLGSVGSWIALFFAKSGVCNSLLIDPDRLETVNNVRHVGGLSNVGRYKTKVMRDMVLDRNPSAIVETIQDGFFAKNIESFREAFSKADLVIDATGDQQSGLLANRLCYETKTTFIKAGVYSKARGGQIHVVEPGFSACLQCYRMAKDESIDRDQEKNESEQVSETSYEYGREIPEPGLELEIMPINVMASNLAIQKLLKNKETTRHSLDEDLIAPLYIWLNRRDPGSPWKSLKPLGFNMHGPRILQWIGVNVLKNPDCPVCGEFYGDDPF